MREVEAELGVSAGRICPEKVTRFYLQIPPNFNLNSLQISLDLLTKILTVRVLRDHPDDVWVVVPNRIRAGGPRCPQ